MKTHNEHLIHYEIELGHIFQFSKKERGSVPLPTLVEPLMCHHARNNK